MTPTPMRRAGLYALCGICLVLIGGCGQPSREVLRFGLQTMPVTLDPRFATDAASARIDRLLYQRLVDFDDRSRVVPALATWRQVTPRQYRFHLRDGDNRFDNGAPVTAADVKATFESVMDPGTASPLRAAVAHVTRIETPDTATVDFFLDAPDPLFPGKLDIGILPAPLIRADHPFNRDPVGSGPFAFAAWPSEDRLRLKRRADGQVIEFDEVPNPTVRVLKLLRGEIDMLQNDLPFELVRYLAHHQGVHVLRSKGTNFTYLGFNMRDPVVGRLAVRKAIAHALDRDAITKYVFAGAARTANAILSPSHWAGAPELQPYAYDPDAARALLAAAGFDTAHPARITYKTSSDPFRVRLATIIQSQLAAVGVDVDIRSYDWGTFYGDIKTGRFQMYSLSWVGVKSPDILRTAFYSTSLPPNGANRGRFQNAAVDRLIDAAESTPDAAVQAADYRRVQRILLEQLPYVPLWYEDHVYIAKNDIAGYSVARDGNYDGLVNVHRVDSSGH
jgi:peptide/nickel transport system substrate-binding protein